MRVGLMFCVALALAGCGGAETMMQPPPAPTLTGTWSLTSTDAQRMSETATLRDDGTFHIDQRVPYGGAGSGLWVTNGVDGHFVADAAAIIVQVADWAEQSRIYVLDGDVLHMTDPDSVATSMPFLVGAYARQ